ncbi:MAG: hypothetical protein MHM6MM_005367 [Cercozoa sp. M6MM]
MSKVLPNDGHVMIRDGRGKWKKAVCRFSEDGNALEVCDASGDKVQQRIPLAVQCDDVAFPIDKESSKKCRFRVSAGTAHAEFHLMSRSDQRQFISVVNEAATEATPAAVAPAVSATDTAGADDAAEAKPAVDTVKLSLRAENTRLVEQNEELLAKIRQLEGEKTDLTARVEELESIVARKPKRQGAGTGKKDEVQFATTAEELNFNDALRRVREPDVAESAGDAPADFLILKYKEGQKNVMELLACEDGGVDALKKHLQPGAGRECFVLLRKTQVFEETSDAADAFLLIT